MDIKEYTNLHREIESRGVKDHEAVDRIWMLTNPGQALPAWEHGEPSEPSEPSKPVGVIKAKEEEEEDGAESSLFPIQAAMTHIIGEMHGDVDTPTVVQRMRSAHSEKLKDKSDVLLTSQVSAKLRKFKQRGWLRIYREGKGAIPNTFRKTEKWGKEEEGDDEDT
jgi:hypothetical protein